MRIDGLVDVGHIYHTTSLLRHSACISRNTVFAILIPKKHVKTRTKLKQTLVSRLFRLLFSQGIPFTPNPWGLRHNRRSLYGQGVATNLDAILDFITITIESFVLNDKCCSLIG